jgi:RNA polymerase sigma-B factor
MRDQDDIGRLHASFALSRDPQARNELVTHYDPLALSLARCFGSRREFREDLAQVARIGLIHAVDRFDPDRGRPFTAFARATIVGELKHHLRDHTWGMRVPRPLQERYLAVIRTADDLTQELGRLPRTPEVAARVGLSEAQVLQAIGVDAVGHIQSLDRTTASGRELDPSEEDYNLERVENRTDLVALLGNLPERTLRTLELRFANGLTQLEIARHVGRSQIWVSRTLTRTLERIRAVADGEQPVPQGALRRSA